MFPLLFQVFKPDHHLKPDDTYQSKPSIASDLVLADAVYGESGPFIQTLREPALGRRNASKPRPVAPSRLACARHAVASLGACVQ